MIVSVRVTSRSGRSSIDGVVDGRLRVRTTAPPADGAANKAVIRLLSDYFGIAPSRIRLVSGMTQRNKRFAVEGPLDLPDGL